MEWNQTRKLLFKCRMSNSLDFHEFLDLVMIKKMWSWFVHIFLMFWEILGKSWFLCILSTGTGEMPHFIQISWWIHSKMFSFLVLSCIFNGVLLRPQKKPEIFNVFIFWEMESKCIWVTTVRPIMLMYLPFQGSS